MQAYTHKQAYIAADMSRDDFVQHAPHAYDRIQVEPLHPIYQQTEQPFTETMFKFPTMPLFVGKFALTQEEIDVIDLNVLRMLIRSSGRRDPVFLPKAAGPLVPLILQNINYHRQFFTPNADAFIYLTVRVCDYESMYYRNSSEWHIDGYQGARISRHKVEQNAFWSNVNPTQFSLQPYFCEGLNPRIHDINEFFDRNTDEAFAVKGVDNGVYFVNPYHVHRVCPEKFVGKRVFVRINFSPVLIEDPTNTVNPCFPDLVIDKREDVRNFLHAYEVDEAVASGLKTCIPAR
jgi:hypothetical protein